MNANGLDRELLSLLQRNRGRVVSYWQIIHHLFREYPVDVPVEKSDEYSQVNTALHRLRERLHPHELIGYVDKSGGRGLRLLNKPR